MNDFSDFIQEIFRDFGEVNCRKMFGGYGVFYDGLMFGLVADDMLYLKTDNDIAHLFEQRDLPQFEYEKKEKTIKMSYHQAPEEIYEDPLEAALWAKRSYEVAWKLKKMKKK